MSKVATEPSTLCAFLTRAGIRECTIDRCKTMAECEMIEEYSIITVQIWRNICVLFECWNNNKSRGRLTITLFRSIAIFRSRIDGISGNIQTECGKYTKIFPGILPVPHNIAMDLNNVMTL
jgi:hypothetical protein